MVITRTLHNMNVEKRRIKKEKREKLIYGTLTIVSIIAMMMFAIYKIPV